MLAVSLSPSSFSPPSAFLRMVTLSQVVSRLWRYRITCATVLFLISAGILDRHSLLNILLLQNKNSELQEEIAHYEKQYKDDSRALELMDVSPEAVEKVARVKLFMKKANEDVYVVVNEGDN